MSENFEYYWRVHVLLVGTPTPLSSVSVPFFCVYYLIYIHANQWTDARNPLRNDGCHGYRKMAPKINNFVYFQCAETEMCPHVTYIKTQNIDNMIVL